MTEPAGTPRQRHVLAELLRFSTVKRQAGERVDALIREAVQLGVSQTAVAAVAGVDQATVSRLVNRAPTARARRGRRSAATTRAHGGTV